MFLGVLSSTIALKLPAGGVNLMRDFPAIRHSNKAFQENNY